MSNLTILNWHENRHNLSSAANNFNKFLNSESKFDVTSPNIQFHLNRFKTFRCDLNRYGGSLIYVHEDILGKPLKVLFFGLNIEIIALRREYVMKYFFETFSWNTTLLNISLHVIWYHETHIKNVKRKPPRTIIRKNEFKRESSVQFFTDRVHIF